MTKYILVGGYVRKAADGGRAFCEELADGFIEPIKILDCLFAETKEVWEEKFAADQILFDSHLDKSFELRLAEVDKFIEQVKWANAIFLRGGSTNKLLSLLKQSLGWEKELEDKTLAGTSAGADAIVKYYYDIDSLKLGDGLGLIPYKTLVHYRSDYNAPNVNWDEAHRELEAYKESLPLLTLAEGEFKVIRS